MSYYYHRIENPAFRDLGDKADGLAKKYSAFFFVGSIIFLALGYSWQKIHFGPNPSLLNNIPFMEQDVAHSSSKNDNNYNNNSLFGQIRIDDYHSPIKPSDKNTLPATKNTINSPEDVYEEPQALEFYTIRKNEKLETALFKVGIDINEIPSILKSIGQIYPIDNIGINAEIRVDYQNEKDKSVKIMNIKLNENQEIVVTRLDSVGNFKTNFRQLDFKPDIKFYKFHYLNNINQSATAIGLSEEMVREIVKLFNYDIDFQRDLKNGDEFEILVDNRVERETGFSAQPIIYLATIRVSGKAISYARFVGKDGKVGYYDVNNGKSQRKGLVKTPILGGGQVSSGFANSRLHPVLNYSRAHRGIDFMAPIGTPVLAAGDGVVVKAERYAGYGNYIRIQHDQQYETAYAHLRSFAKHIKPGVRVRQNEIIGYVGVTGLTTGPHLHYEVIRDGEQINPILKLASIGGGIGDDEISAFREKVSEYRNMLKNVPLITDQ